MSEWWKEFMTLTARVCFCMGVCMGVWMPEETAWWVTILFVVMAAVYVLRFLICHHGYSQERIDP